MSTPRKLVAGNWKMNGLAEDVGEALAVSRDLADRPAACRVALCPPATLIHRFAQALRDGPVEVGAQDCHPEPKGAHTGDVSAEMLRDAGARLVVLGHSERRVDHGEDDALVSRKVLAALRAGLEPLVCVGESAEVRAAGGAEAAVLTQLRASLPEALEGRRFVVAYEPVWAIGSGRTPSGTEIEDMHRAIRRELDGRFPGASAPVLYGGSVTPRNAEAILGLAEVGGALVGGASLKAEDFLTVVRGA